MILDFKLPAVSPHVNEALLECIYVSAGTAVKPGDKLLDLSVNLNNAFEQDCPPVSFFRVIVREKAIMREFRAARGESRKLDEVVAIFSTDPNEPLDQPAQRGLRVATAGIIHHAGLWTGNDA